MKNRKLLNRLASDIEQFASQVGGFHILARLIDAGVGRHGYKYLPKGRTQETRNAKTRLWQKNLRAAKRVLEESGYVFEDDEEAELGRIVIGIQLMADLVGGYSTLASSFGYDASQIDGDF